MDGFCEERANEEFGKEHVAVGTGRLCLIGSGGKCVGPDHDRGVHPYRCAGFAGGGDECRGRGGRTAGL